MDENSIILGIDPGSVITGYGVIRKGRSKPIPIDFGCIRPSKTATSSQKYLEIFNGIDTLITRYQPHAIAVETQFVHKNVASALKLGMAKGVVLLAAARKNIPIYEYAPKKAKLAVVGHGNASKNQVQRMIQLLLSLPDLPEPEDAADALALAICHAHTIRTVIC